MRGSSRLVNRGVGASVSAPRVAAPSGSCPFALRQTFACCVPRAPGVLTPFWSRGPLLHDDDDRRLCLSPSDLSSERRFRARGRRAYVGLRSRTGRASKAVTGDPVQSVPPASPPAPRAVLLFPTD